MEHKQTDQRIITWRLDVKLYRPFRKSELPLLFPEELVEHKAEFPVFKIGRFESTLHNVAMVSAGIHSMYFKMTEDEMDELQDKLFGIPDFKQIGRTRVTTN